MATPRKIRQINYRATAEKSPKCSNCQSMEELKDFFKSEMAVLSGQFKLVLEEQAQQKIQIAQLLRERSEAEGLSSLFPVTDKDELICLDHQIELGNRNWFVKIMTELLGSSGPKANLKYIITDELAMQYNVDGILGKASLKSLSFFYKALLDAISNCAVGPPKSRQRCANFTPEEEAELVALVKANQSVLENKKSDAITWKQKPSGWEKLATGVPRTVKTCHPPVKTCHPRPMTRHLKPLWTSKF
ncbi:hypothetical protein ACLKA6_010171 [Drosophila palustris]